MPAQVKHIPDGASAVTPYLVVSKAAELAPVGPTGGAAGEPEKPASYGFILDGRQGSSRGVPEGRELPGRARHRGHVTGLTR